jgi:hypothetical protein
MRKMFDAPELDAFQRRAARLRANRPCAATLSR